MLSNEVDGDQVFKETRFNNSNSSKKEKKGINIMPMASLMSLGSTPVRSKSKAKNEGFAS